MRSGSSRYVAIGAGGLAVLLGAIDTYVVVTIMEDIMRDVGIGVNQIQRVTPIITGYLLFYVAAMPLLGRSSDRFGRKTVLQLGLVFFAIGSVITAASADLGNALAGDLDYLDLEMFGRVLPIGTTLSDMSGILTPLNILIFGRVLQGAASGALLPVTLALAADLWPARDRTKILGGIGAAQELGSVLGPLWGIAVVAMLSTWKDVFWINVPFTLLAMVLIQISLPGHDRSTTKTEKVDVVGGLLLAVALGLAVLGLYNPNPDGKQILPDWGVPMVIGAAVAAVLFLLWEWQAKTRLIDPRNMRVVPFLAAMAASACTGAALMVTLVNVELFGRGVAGLSQSDAALALMWFLVALPIGAVVGGFLAERFGDRTVVIPGMLIASFGYLLISHWDVDVMTEHHQLGPIALPTFDTDLIIAGVGLGLVIAPLTSAALRVVPKAQHGIASSLVVVARMVGMLVGVAALSAWGLYRFHQIMSAANPSLAEIGAVSRRAFAQQYGEIFGATAVICLIGAALGLLIAGRNVNVDGDDEDDAAAPEIAGDADEVTVPSGRDEVVDGAGRREVQ